MPEDEMTSFFPSLDVPDGCTLRRKQQFEYTTTDQMYDIELFENQDGTFYAIGIPKSGQMVVYGSNVVKSPTIAMRVVLDKIEREGPHFEAASRGQNAP